MFVSLIPTHRSLGIRLYRMFVNPNSYCNFTKPRIHVNVAICGTSQLVFESLCMWHPPTGAKIHQSRGKIHCIEEGGVNHSLKEGSQIPETVTASYQHTQEV